MIRFASSRLGVFAFLASAATAGPARADEKLAAPAARPNVLLFIADDEHRASVGCYGKTPGHTPNIDRLASEGIRFDRAFTPSAMCTPSRSCLFTGLDPMRHGAHPNHARMKPEIETFPKWMQSAGYRTAIYGKAGIRPFTGFTWDDILENTGKVPGSTSKFTFDFGRVEKFLEADPGKPFLLVLSSHFPHAPYIEPGGYDASDRQMDGELGAGLDLLKKHGLEKNTLVVYVSDNGAGIPRAKWTVYDAGCLLPLIVRWPGRVKTGSSTAAMVSFIDLAPTILEAAGAAVPAGLDGRSFLGVLEGKADRHRDEIYLTQTTMGVNNVTVPYPSRAVRTEQYKYILNLNPGVPHPVTKEKPPAEELYDVVKDPGERQNLAADPVNAAVLGELRRKLDAWMKQQEDGGLEAEKKIPVRLLAGDEDGASPPADPKTNPKAPRNAKNK